MAARAAHDKCRAPIAVQAMLTATAFFDGLCCSYSTLRKTASVEDIFRADIFSSAGEVFSSASGAWGPTFAERIEPRVSDQSIFRVFQEYAG